MRSRLLKRTIPIVSERSFTVVASGLFVMEYFASLAKSFYQHSSQTKSLPNSWAQIRP